MPKRTINARINAGDVAEMAQVSRSAVSRTFTIGASVSPETRARVMAAATTLGYSPARKLRAPGESVDRSVAVIMANMLSPYFAEVCERLDREIAGNGLRTMFLICADVTQIDQVVEDALARDVAGIIISSAFPSDAALAAAQAADVPVVLLNRSEQAQGASLVWIDGPETGRAVAQMMLAEGRRSPVAIATTPGRSRELIAFAEAMEAGGSARCRWIDTGWGYDDGVRAAATLYARGVQPDAIFAGSDALAIGFLDAVRTRHHIAVPEEMSIIGFGNTASSDWMSHRISSVRVPIGALIQTAVSTLLARLGGGGEPEPRIWLGCDIIERESSRGTTLP
jgi:DNA-binding LacI/PurR family transcriptional regulator